MKKKSVWLTACLVAGSMWTSCTTGPKVAENEFWIEGTLENVEDGALITLCSVKDHFYHKLAVDTLTNGHFSFRDTLSGTGTYALECEGAVTWIDFWMAPGKKVSVFGDNLNLRTWSVQCPIPEQEAQSLLAQAVRAEWMQLEPVMKEQDKWRQIGNANLDNDSILRIARAKMHSLQNSEDSIEDRILQKQLEVLQTMPIGEVWFDTFLSLAEIPTYDPDFPYEQDLKTLFNRLSEADKQTPKGKMIVHYMNLPKAVKVGDRMPDADLYDVNGGLHHLSELKGRYMLLDFWSTGCGPCLKSIPELEEIAELYKEKIAVVSISEDPEERWKDFVITQKLKGYQWNELRGRSGLFAALRIRGIPYYVLVSPDGKIQETWSGYGEGSLNKKMESLFK